MDTERTAAQTGAMWLDFLEKVLPNRQGWLSRHLGRDVPIEIDYPSFGDDPSAAEGLAYALEMLVRGLEPEPWDPYERRGAPVDVARLHAGIERVRIRAARTPGDMELAVRDGCLHVSYLGSFGPGEVECLLTERGLDRVERDSNPPPAGLSEDLVAMRRWRLGPLLRQIEWAAGRSVPVELDWAGLDALPDVRERAGRLLLRNLESVAQALDDLLRDSEATGPMSPARRDRSDRRREETREAVAGAIRGGRVRADRASLEPAARFADGVVEVTLGPGRHAIRAARDADAVRDALAEGVEPLRRDLEAEDVPATRALLRSLLAGAIADQGGPAPERVALRQLLGEGPALEVDWASFLAAGDRARVLAALETLECGEHAVDSGHGPFFRWFFPALEEAIRKDASFLRTFLERVRKIEVDLDPEPRRASIRVRGSSLVLRQGIEGSISSDAAREDLVGAVLGMGTPDGSDETGEVVGRLAELLGVRFGSTGELPATAIEDAARLVVGTLRGLSEDPVARERLESGLQAVELVPTEGREAARVEGGTLRLLVAAGPSAPRLPAPSEIRTALDEGLALAAAVRIAEWEGSGRASWEAMLAREENFDRRLPIEVDWPAFLGAPAGGGNQVVPYFIDDGAVKRLVYALTGWMADDPDFAERLRESIRSIRIGCIPEDGEATLELAGGVLAFGVAARTYYTDRGTATIDELQMRLHDLFE